MSEAMVPNAKGTLTLSATSTPASVALPAGGGELVEVVNVGPSLAFLEFTPSGGANASASYSVPIVANVAARQFRLRATDANVSYVSANTSTVYITRGQKVS